jgi:flagellar basal-body rod protein FlgG
MLSLDIGATGMLAQQLNVDVISNNIANMTTTGFKRQRAEFQDLVYINRQRPGSQAADDGTILPSGIQLGVGVKTGAVYRNQEQGPMQPTGNKLDLAISGEGFYQVTLPSGETAYTRAGALQLNNNGEVVTVQGYLVEPSITLPPDTLDVIVNASGEVSYKQAGTTTYTVAGQIQLASFPNSGGLEAIGNTMFLETEASGAPITGNPQTENFGEIQQGFLESSNVNVVEEITKLITAQRAYDMNSKTIQVSDEMLGTITQLR